MLIHPIQSAEVYPVGAMVDAYAPPSDNWIHCDGSVLAQADYPILYSMMDNPHPNRFVEWEWQSGFPSGYGAFCAAYNGTRWVALGDGEGWYSSDGESWTAITMPNSGTYYDVIWNGSIFCAVANGSTNAMTSSDGITWTSRTLSASASYYGLCWDGTYFYTVGNNSGNVIRSSDGITWATVGTAQSGQWYGIQCDGTAGNILVLLGNSGKFSYSEDGGANWVNLRTGIFNARYTIYEDSQFINCGYYGDVAVSPDGKFWEIYHRGINDYQNVRSYNNEYAQSWRIRKCGSIYVSVPYYANQASYSFDLKVWEPMTGVNDLEFYDVIYNSSSEKLILLGYMPEIVVGSFSNHYDDSTHFQLPTCERHQDYGHITKMKKYIRVR